MKLFISSDIEGTSGICAWPETELSQPDYHSYFRDQMTREVAAACEGALESGGIDGILIKDAHDDARNIHPENLPKDRRIRLIRGWVTEPGNMMAGMQECDVCAMTGYHSSCYTDSNPLSHTNNLQNQWIRLNGEIMSEFVMNTYAAAYFGKPVLMVSGDAGLCDVVKKFCPAIETVATMEGRGDASVSVHPDFAVEDIKAAMQRAIEHYRKDPAAFVIRMPEHFKAEVEFKEHVKAKRGSFYPGAVRTGAKSIAFESDSYYEIMRFFYFTL